MRKVDRILRAAVQSEEILQAARAQALLRDWTEIVGETLAKKSWPDRYARGTVWVAVEGSAWATELRMRKGDILQRLRDRAEDGTLFKDVRFGVRTLPDHPPVESAEPAPKTEDEPPIEALSIREIAERRLANWKDR